MTGSQHPADLKPRGEKAPLYLIPFEALPAEFSPWDGGAFDPALILRRLVTLYGLAPTMEACARALEFGAKKYARDNWRSFTWDAAAEDEYSGAIARHLLAARSGEERAPDSGVLHVGHAAAGCVIMLWHRAQAQK